MLIKAHPVINNCEKLFQNLMVDVMRMYVYVYVYRH